MTAKRTLSFLSIFTLTAIALLGITRLGTAATPIQGTVSISGVLTEGTSSISGWVRQADGTTPIPGTGIYFRDYYSDQFLGSATSGPDGAYTITGLDGRDYRVSAKADGFAWEYYQDTPAFGEAQAVSLAEGEALGGINFTLDPTGIITGTVYDASGTEQLAGIGVATTLDGQGTCTDDDGNYSLELVYGTHIIVAGWDFCDPENYLEEYWQEVPDRDSATPITLSEANLLVTGIDFTLDAGGMITGTVTAHGGALIEGARVSAYMADNGDWMGEDLTNDQGYFSIGGLPSGQYTVDADHDDYSWEYYQDAMIPYYADTITVTVGQSTPNIDFELETGGTISGTILNSDGSEVITDEVYVELLLRDGIRDVDITTDGTFTFDYAPFDVPLYLLAWSGPDGGPYLMEYWEEAVGWDDAATLTLTTLNPTVSNITFTLDMGGSISGTVTAPGGAPIEGATVQAYNAETRDRVGQGESDADGNYTVGGLTTGDYIVEADHSDYAYEYYPDAAIFSYADPISVTVGLATHDINFELDTGGTITGTVLNSDGTEIITDEIYIELLQYGGIRAVDITTDGTFSFDYVPFDIPFNMLAWSGPDGGPYLMEYWEEAIGWDDASTLTLTTLNPTVSHITFTLDAGGMITGTVTAEDGGSQIDGARVCIIKSGSGDWWNNCQDTLSDGTYTIEGLDTGDYYVRADADGYAYETYDDALKNTETISIPVSINTVTPDINFALGPGGTIHGVVLDAEGESPRDNIYVELLLLDSIRSVYITDDDGIFSFDDVPYDIGYYLLAWGGPYNDIYIMEFWEETDGFSTGTTVTVNAENPIANPITFTIALAGGISGTVTAAEGSAPIAGAEVCFRAYDLSRDFNCVTTDSNGDYTQDYLPSGEFQVRVFEPGWAWQYYDGVLDADASTPVTVTEGAITPGIDFALQPGGSIGGTVTEADGETPIENLTMALYGVGGWDACTGVDGSYSFQSLPLGYTFTIQTGPAGNFCGGPDHYAAKFWPDTYFEDQAVPIALTESVPDQDWIDFSLEAGATITGTVYESDGSTPVETACIFASPSAPELAPLGEGEFQGGAFILQKLPPIDLYLRTAADCLGGDTGLQDAWYAAAGSTPDASLAEAIALTPGETITGLVFILEPVASGTVAPITGGTITSTADITTSLDFPAGAVSEPVTVTIEITTSTPTGSDFLFVGQTFAIEAVAADGTPVTTFTEPFTLTLQYSDADIAGLDEASLALYYWDLAGETWVAVPAVLDLQANTLTAVLDHLTDFAAFGSPYRIYLPVVIR